MTLLGFMYTFNTFLIIEDGKPSLVWFFFFLVCCLLPIRCCCMPINTIESFKLQVILGCGE